MIGVALVVAAAVADVVPGVVVGLLAYAAGVGVVVEDAAERRVLGDAEALVLEEAAERMTGEKAVFIAAGRTDAGVHATGQVAHLVLARDWPADTVRDALNAHLQLARETVTILGATVVAEEFDARFSATGRHYLYRILNRRSPPALERHRVWWVARSLDHEAMHDAAQVLVRGGLRRGAGRLQVLHVARQAGRVRQQVKQADFSAQPIAEFRDHFGDLARQRQLAALAGGRAALVVLSKL